MCLTKWRGSSEMPYAPESMVTSLRGAARSACSLVSFHQLPAEPYTRNPIPRSAGALPFSAEAQDFGNEEKIMRTSLRRACRSACSLLSSHQPAASSRRRKRAAGSRARHVAISPAVR